MLLAAVAMAAPLGAAASAQAASQTWKSAGFTDGNWSTATNWVNGAVPGANSTGATNSDVATFNGAANLTVTVDATRSIGSLYFDTADAGAYTITSGALYLISGGAISISSSVLNTQTINTPLTLSNNTTSKTYAFINDSATAGVNLLIAGSVTARNSGTTTLTLGGANNGTLSGDLIKSGSGAFNVAKTGAGTWTLTGNNGQSNTNVNGGTLNFNSAGAAGTVGSTLTFTSGTFDNTSGGALTLTSTGNITWAGDITYGGTNALAFTGGNLLFGTNRVMTLNGDLTFGGSLNGTDDGNNRTATFNGDGRTVTFGGWSIKTGGSGGRTYSIAGDADVLINGAVINGQGTNGFIYAGTGVLTFAADGNAYTGSATVNTGGTLQIGNGGTTGNLPSNVTNNGTVIFNRSNDYNQATNITGSGGVEKKGAGAITLGGANTFSSGLTVSGGSVIASNASATVLGSGRISMANSTSINLNGFGPTTGLLRTIGDGTGVSIVNNTGASVSAKTLTLSAASGSETFAGVIADNSDAGSGTLALAKTGAGVQTFAGANSYSGGTTLTAGGINLTGAGTLGASTGSLVINGSSILDLGTTTQTQAAVTMSAAATIQGGTLSSSAFAVSNATGTAVITSSLGGAAAFNKTGAGIVAMQDTSTYAGPTTIGAGILRLLGNDLPSVNSNVSVIGTANVELTANTNLALGTGANQISLGGSTNGVGAFGGDFTLDLGSITWASGGFAPSTAFQLGTTTSTGKVTLASNIDLNGALRTITTVHGSVTGPDAEISGTISGVGPLVYIGGGTIVASGSNTYTAASGATPTIVTSNTTLVVSNLGNIGDATSSVGGTSVNTRNGEIGLGGSGNTGTLRYTGTGETSNRVIRIGLSTSGAATSSGIAAIESSGTGALTLTANPVASLTGTGSSGHIVLGGTNTDDNVFAGKLFQGTGVTTANYNSIRKTGTGTWILNTVQAHWGGIRVADGTLVAGANAQGYTIATGDFDSTTRSLTVADISLFPGIAVGDYIFSDTGLTTGTSAPVRVNTISAISGNVITFSGSGVVNNVTGASFEWAKPTGGAFGIAHEGSGRTVLGTSNGTANPAILIGGAFTVATPIYIDNYTNTSYTLGGRTSSTATFSGRITANQSFSLTQASGGTLNVTGGVTGSTVADNGTQTVTFAGPGAINLSANGISDGSGGGTTKTAVAVSGGTTSLDIASTYSGGTTVSGGTLRVNNTTGSGTGSGAVGVGTGGTIGGTGTIAGALTVNGTLAPGNSAGRLTVANNVTLGSTATFAAEVNGTTAGTDYDQLTIDGDFSLQLGGGLLVSMGTFAASEGQYIYLIDNSGPGATSGTFAGLAEGAQIASLNGVNGYNWHITYSAVYGNPEGNSNDVAIFAVDAVPEPGAVALLAVTGAGLLARRTRRNRAC